MGAGQSSGIDIGGSTMGYQVLRVYPNSPGSRAGLKAYFDFIVAIGNTRFNRENGSLREILKASVDQKLQMVVYNTRTKKVRETEIVPSTNWGGNGLLGVSIKHSSFDRADERVWHVVEVEPGSPAQQAGFRVNEDYVIGSDSILQENDDLYNLVEAHEGKALKLFVYNTQTDNCREVICHPNSRWGGKGLLGCEFGHGLLHRIPYVGDGDENVDENPRASLLNNEHGAGQTHPPTSAPHMLSNPNQLNQNQMVHQFQQGPGHQLLQQALSDRAPQQQQPGPIDKVLPPPPPAVPQTFAQLANAQFQSQSNSFNSPPKPSTPQLSQANTNSQESNVANTSLIQNQTQPNMKPPTYPSQQPSLFQQQMQILQQPDLQQQHQQQIQAPLAHQPNQQFQQQSNQHQPSPPPYQQPQPQPQLQSQQQPQQPSPPLPQYQMPELSRPSYPTQQQQPSLFQQQAQLLQQPEVQQYQSDQHQQQANAQSQPVQPQSNQQIPQQLQSPQQAQLPPPPLPPQLQHQSQQNEQQLGQQTLNYHLQQQTSRRYPEMPPNAYQTQQVPPNLQQVNQQQSNYPPPPPDSLNQG